MVKRSDKIIGKLPSSLKVVEARNMINDAVKILQMTGRPEYLSLTEKQFIGMAVLDVSNQIISEYIKARQRKLAEQEEKRDGKAGDTNPKSDNKKVRVKKSTDSPKLEKKRKSTKGGNDSGDDKKPSKKG